MCTLNDTYFACGHNAGQSMHRTYCERYELTMLCTLTCLRTVILSYCEPCQAVLEDAGRRLLGFESVVFSVDGITEDDYWGNSETDSEDHSEYDSENESELELEPEGRYRRSDESESQGSTQQSSENNRGYQRPYEAEPDSTRLWGNGNGRRYHDQGNGTSDEAESYQERRRDTEYYPRYTRSDEARAHVRTRWGTEMDTREEYSSSEGEAYSNYSDPMDIDMDIGMAN